jgi:hypothetical protein
VRDPESAGRAALRRGMVIYGVLFAVAVLVVWYIVSNEPRGLGYLTLSIVGLVGLLLGYQLWSHARDIGSPLVETEGEVVRKWSRADLVIAMHSFYIMVDRTVLRVQPDDYLAIDVGSYVKVVHFPRTLNTVSVHIVNGQRPGDVV